MKHYLVEAQGRGTTVLQAAEYTNLALALRVAKHAADRARTYCLVDVERVVLRGPGGEVEWQKQVWRR